MSGVWCISMDAIEPVDYEAIERKRHRCEVRWLIAERNKRKGLAGRMWLKTYLNSSAVSGRRDQLMKDIVTQWRLGNRGEPGEWYVGE